MGGRSLLLHSDQHELVSPPKSYSYCDCHTDHLGFYISCLPRYSCITIRLLGSSREASACLDSALTGTKMPQYSASYSALPQRKTGDLMHLMRSPMCGARWTILSPSQ
jgi:hypothetical protein